MGKPLGDNRLKWRQKMYVLSIVPSPVGGRVIGMQIVTWME